MPISIMIKPASSACNLRCEYCFYSSLSSERQEANKGMMSAETAENIIKSALEFSLDSIFFVFQGGEPLLRGINFFRGFVDTVKELNKSKTEIMYSLQTNGTLLNEEWCEFFKENNFLIGVSLDGDKELNSYRKYPNGENSYDDILKGIELLKKYDVPFNILSVLTKRTAQNINHAYRYFKSSGYGYMQFIPCLKPFNAEDNEYSMSSGDYERYLKNSFKLYFNDKVRHKNTSIRQFDNYLLLSLGRCAEQCGMNGCCSYQFVVEGDGSVYPCDFYCTDDWLLGNINNASFRELHRSEKAKNFIKSSVEIKDECRKCRYFYLCKGGGCRRNTEAYDYCESYKKFFDENEKLIIELSTKHIR